MVQPRSRGLGFLFCCPNVFVFFEREGGRRNQTVCLLWGCPRFSVQRRQQQVDDVEQENAFETQKSGFGVQVRGLGFTV